MEKTKLPETRAEVCPKCRYGDEIGNNIIVCRFKPPVALAALAMINVPGTKQQQAAWQNYTAWPVMQPTDWCGSWIAKLNG